MDSCLPCVDIFDTAPFDGILSVPHLNFSLSRLLTYLYFEAVFRPWVLAVCICKASRDKSFTRVN